MSHNPYQNNYYPSGYYGHMSAPGHPNSSGQIRGGFEYGGNQFWDYGDGTQWQNYQGYPYSSNAIYGGPDPYLAYNLNPWHQQQTMGIGGPLQGIGEPLQGIGGPLQGSWRPTGFDFNNMGSRGQFQRGTAGPHGPLGTSRSGFNNLGSRGQNQSGNGGSQGPWGTSRSGFNNLGSHGQHQRGNGGSQGPRGTSRSGFNNVGSRGQNQRGNGEPQGTSRSGFNNLGSHGQHQRGNGGSQGPRGTSRSGFNNVGSRGQNQRGNGEPRGTSRSGFNNLGSHGQHQRGNGGSQGPQRTSRSGFDNLGSRGQNQRGNGEPRGTSRSGFDNLGSRGQNQRGNGEPRGTSRSGFDNLGSGQNQRGNGEPRGTSRSGFNNLGSRGQHQGGNRGSQGPQKTSRSGFNNLGSRGQNQRGTAPAQGSWRKSRSDSNDLESRDQRGNRNENKGTGTTCIPKAQQESEILEKYLDFSFLVQPDVVDLMKQFKVMFILRGVPCSGKTTVADALFKKYQGDAVICSADYYRYNKQGEYVWSKESLGETHTKCQRRADKYCSQNKPVVIIDNTNVMPFEMRPYFQTANKYGYIVVLAEPRTPWKLNPRELAKRNKHNVPFTLLSRKCEQFEDIFPLYFAWFVSPKYCSLLREGAEVILQGCLEIDDYQEYMARLSGKNASDYTVHDATSMYSITKADSHHGLHVTACFSPNGKCLGGSPYIESRQVQNALGHISWITIVGWVMTQKTFSARVSLTKQQQKLWKNEDRQRHGRTPTACRVAEETSSMLENLTIEEKGASDECEKAGNETSKQPCVPNVASHITLGAAKNVDPVEAKSDNRTIIDLELDNHPYDEYVISNATVRKYGDVMWVVYLSDAIKVPGLFSGCYSAS